MKPYRAVMCRHEVQRLTAEVKGLRSELDKNTIKNLQKKSKNALLSSGKSKDGRSSSGSGSSEDQKWLDTVSLTRDELLRVSLGVVEQMGKSSPLRR